MALGRRGRGDAADAYAPEPTMAIYATAFAQENMPPPPPDGGYGWFCVLAQFLINGFTWGVAASYSVYLAHYLSHDIFPEASSVDYAFIGGFNFAFALLSAPLATLLIRIGGARTPMLLGAILLPLGFASASFAIRVWHLYLSQGLCVGVGIGLIYIPATAIIPQWFDKKRSLANGISAAGSGIGGLSLCFSAQVMLDTVGLALTLRITAVIVFVVNLSATIVMRSRNREIKPDMHLLKLHLLSSYQVRLLLAWSVVIMFGYMTLMFSLSDYALAIGRSRQNSATVAAVLNLGAAIGRPLIGYLSDRMGRVVVAGSATFATGILVFALWLPTTEYGLLIPFALISGAILGIFWAAIGPLAADMVDLKELTALLTIVWLSVAAPSACAEAIALQLRHSDFGPRSYTYAQIFAGVSYVAASGIMLELWRVRRAAERIMQSNLPHGGDIRGSSP
ncbi:hypothetical protein PFICI_08371 [Pestalotiopsis fici W106-1]|uniref:Major facilitator superfamily (MFS) profile domain-containing protein n=1 Tax=Pestalotiopsis fici (strain W106-1 / CGMCC3.15140) TaxID=1229662 RepID=W3X635_PESFW|nr:uncharacterized protein PFICI_08371 [Pestalotiopsis fici W106-1]ETS80842.1 hypothetical protein PFICI_08371 [Pestalotiopsis fici W106-1]